MTLGRLGLLASLLLLLASVGCRQADRRVHAALWNGNIFSEPVPAPSAPSAPKTSSASTASVQPAAANFAAEPVMPRVEYELPGNPQPDVKFELLDTPPPVATDQPYCDFLDTLSPRARCFFDEGNGEFDSPPSRFAITRHHVREDLLCGWQRLKQDYRNYYSWDGLGVLAVGFGLGAAVANTNADQRVQEWYQDDVRSQLSNDFSRWAKFPGEGWFVVATATTGWLAGEVFYDRPVPGVLGEWGGRTMRSLGVGTPPMLLMQSVTGGSRPVEDIGSRWHPFEDNNGVSGHAFMGALPFMNAAKMCERWPAKAAFYACSLGPGWSRMNDDSHFMSQALLGWWMAYWAATAVDLTNRDERSQWSAVTTTVGDATVVGVVYSY